MKIYDNSGVEILDVIVDDNSYRSRAIMGDNSLVLYFALPTHTEIPVGAYCDYQNTRYTLYRPEALKMKHSRLFEYTVTMEANQYCAKIWKFRNTVDGRIKFPLTAKPHEHLQMFVDNMNRRDSGWSIGECIDDVEHLITYDGAYCLEALQQMADEFDTEYEIVGKTVSLHKVEYNKTAPLSLSYGKGNGFKPDIGRSNSSDAMPTEILFVQGGEDNINPSEYGNSCLLLPKGQTLKYDGSKFEGETGYDSSLAHEYIASADGLSVQRNDCGLSSKAEDVLDCTDIYPRRVGEVGSVVVVDAANNFYDFTDKNTASDPCPNYEDYLIEGETMTVIFQSGQLAGREFEVKYIHNAKTEKGVAKAARRFEIVPQEIDGVTMPDATFKPAVGDKYVVFHCYLPAAYIRDDASKSGASWDMFRTAVKRLYEDGQQKFSFTGTLDGLWAKKDWTNIGGKIILGGYISFTDERFQKDAVRVRITAVKDYINDPHSPEVTLSNETVTGGFSSTIKQAIADDEVLHGETLAAAERFTKRRFRDAQETMKMLEKSLIEGYSETISPVAARMLQLLVGDDSLQFRFVEDYGLEDPTIVSPTFAFNPTTGLFTIDGGYYMEHLTLGINSVRSEHDVDEYQWWEVEAYQSSVLTDGDKRYYIYLKCPTSSGSSGEYLLSETAIAKDAVTGYYHFLVGVLNSEYEGSRTVTTLYGFTEITGGRITTDKIISNDRHTYFDLANNQIGGFINFVDGLVSGLIGVGNEQGINAGLNGVGYNDTDIRFWSGSSAATRANAPFRVQHNGKMYASDAEISGTVNADRGILNNVTVKGSMSSEIVLWRTSDIKVSASDTAVFTRYPMSDSTSIHKYCFARFYTYGASSIAVYLIYADKEYPAVGDPVYRTSGASADVYATVTEILPVNVIDGNSDGSERHDNVILPQLNARAVSQTITADQFSWDASNIGRTVRLLNYKYATEPDGYIILKAPTGKYFYECGYRTDTICLSREYVELYGYGALDTFYGWIVVNRQDIVTRGEYGMPWKVIYQGCVNPYASPQLERVWDVDLNIKGAGSVNYSYTKLATGKYKITLPRLLSKYDPATATTIYEKSWHVIVIPRSCFVDGTSPSPSHITCGYACLAGKGHENNRSYFIVETADDDSKNDLGFDFYVISMANWLEPSTT